MSKTISARIDETLHDRLRNLCNDEGITVNDKIKQILDENLNHSSCSMDSEVIQELKEKEPKEVKPKEKDKESQKISENDDSDLEKMLEKLLKSLTNSNKKEEKIPLVEPKEEKRNFQPKEKLNCVPLHNRKGLHCCTTANCSSLKLKGHTFS